MVGALIQVFPCAASAAWGVDTAEHEAQESCQPDLLQIHGPRGHSDGRLSIYSTDDERRARVEESSTRQDGHDHTNLLIRQRMVVN